MKAPHRIDLNTSDIWAGFVDILRSRSESDTYMLPGGPKALITLSVRSALDLYLRAKALPYGSEVIVSAITHPDMVEILRSHGLKPVPVDLEFDSAAPSARAIRTAASAATRAVLIAHLFGALAPMDKIGAICRERGWLLIEDCAQAFGLGYEGHGYSELTLFSFGPLKTATALGGALAIVRDPDTLATMAAIQTKYPRQPRTVFLKRLALYAFLWIVSHPGLYGSVYQVLRLLGRDPSKVMRGLTKSFSGDFDIERFRRRLADPQITFLKRRAACISADRIGRRAEMGERLSEALTEALHCVRRFGASGINRTHWIFPITVADPEAVIRQLESEGIHAMRGLSNLAVVNGTRDSDALAVARSALAGSLLVPLPAWCDDEHIHRIARAVRSVHSGNRKRLRVATINLWSGLDYQGWFRCGSYETNSEREFRYRHLVARLRALDADVITVNEANPVSKMMRRLARDLSYDEIHWRGLAGLRLGPVGLPVNLDEGDGILARRDLNLVPVGRARLTGGLLGRWGSLNFANATQLICGRISLDGVPIYLFNTHWTVARTGAAYAAQATRRDAGLDSHTEASAIRSLEAERTVAAIRALLPAGSGAVLAGDFNTVSSSQEIRALEDAGFVDAVGHLNPSAEAATWNPMRNDIIRKFYGNHPSSSESPVRVDYIFVNHTLVPVLQQARLALNGPSDRPHPSDHFALVCDLLMERDRALDCTAESIKTDTADSIGVFAHR